MVLVSREERRAIFEYLLKEGVIVVKKDAYLPQHGQITSICNLHVMMIVKSLKSRGCLNEVYSWGWSYYFLTNQGVEYLIKELGLPVDCLIVPATHAKKRAKVIVTKDGEKGEEGEEEKPVKEE